MLLVQKHRPEMHPPTAVKNTMPHASSWKPPQGHTNNHTIIVHTWCVWCGGLQPVWFHSCIVNQPNYTQFHFWHPCPWGQPIVCFVCFSCHEWNQEGNVIMKTYTVNLRWHIHTGCTCWHACTTKNSLHMHCATLQCMCFSLFRHTIKTHESSIRVPYTVVITERAAHYLATFFLLSNDKGINVLLICSHMYACLALYSEGAHHTCVVWHIACDNQINM